MADSPGDRNASERTARDRIPKWSFP